MTQAEIQAERRRLREKYGTLFDEISAILFRHDPMGISYVKDEYDPEAGTIITRLHGARSADDVCLIVYQELVHWFGQTEVATMASCAELAAEIWRAELAFRAKG